MLAINPKDGDPNLLWRFYQYYEDGFKEEFTAAPDAKMPLQQQQQVETKGGNPLRTRHPGLAESHTFGNSAWGLRDPSITDRSARCGAPLAAAPLTGACGAALLRMAVCGGAMVSEA
jgi:hypothetical protein